MLQSYAVDGATAPVCPLVCDGWHTNVYVRTGLEKSATARKALRITSSRFMGDRLVQKTQSYHALFVFIYFFVRDGGGEVTVIPLSDCRPSSGNASAVCELGKQPAGSVAGRRSPHPGVSRGQVSGTTSDFTVGTKQQIPE